jgi:uncharacterized protein
VTGPYGIMPSPASQDIRAVRGKQLDPRAQQLIAELELQPHPEGGYYRELFRSAACVQPADARPARAALTTIYFLLPAGSHSRWHRVSSDEVWHLYEGDGLELLIADEQLSGVRRVVLGSASRDVDPVFVVPAGWWQAARPLGNYTLVGCTVGPGFEFDDFSFLRGEQALAEKLHTLDAAAADLL